MDRDSKAKFVNRRISATIDGISWEVHHANPKQRENLTKLKTSVSSKSQRASALKSFAEMVHLELSLSALNAKAVNAALPKDWEKNQSHLKPSTQTITNLEVKKNSICFSLLAEWVEIPIRASIKCMEDFTKIVEWPTDLIDHLWTNSNGKKLLGEIEEIGIEEKVVKVCFDDEQVPASVNNKCKMKERLKASLNSVNEMKPSLSDLPTLILIIE